MLPIQLKQPPLVISIICFIALINAAQLSYMAFSPVSKQMGSLYPTYFAFSAIVSLLSIVGMWSLKKWAALLYVAVLLSNQLVLVSMGLWEVSAALVPGVIIILLFNNREKMS